MPGLTTAHTAGTVTADQWVDDLESERWATTRGFESLRRLSRSSWIFRRRSLA